MKGDPKVIEALLASYATEIHIHEQLRLDARTLKYMGVDKVAKKIRQNADDAHCFRKYLAKRILFLGGTLAAKVGDISERGTVTELLQADLAMESAILPSQEQAIQTATLAYDDATRNLFEHLIKWRQKNVCWYEQQLGLIEAMGGEAAYITTKV